MGYELLSTEYRLRKSSLLLTVRSIMHQKKKKKLRMEFLLGVRTNLATQCYGVQHQIRENQ